MGALLGWRLVFCLRERRIEGVFWTAAAASFAPVSQLFPFLHPVADRYLYFMLPGLIGGVLLWGSAPWRRLIEAADPLRARRAALAGLAVALAACGLFAFWSEARARLWRAETLLLFDAARHYPEGGTAAFLRARAAAQRGDVEATLVALRAAADRGFDNFGSLERDPGLAPVRRDPAFRALVAEIAGRWIDRARERGYSTQAELRMLGMAHLAREEYTEAVAAYEAALAAGGPLEPQVRAELGRARTRLASRSARDAQGDDGG